MKFRIEHDSMGQVKVPESALFGAQTQRAVENFGLLSRPMPSGFVRCLAQIKAAAAAIAKRSYAENRPVLDVAVEETGLSREKLSALLDPSRLTKSRIARVNK